MLSVEKLGPTLTATIGALAPVFAVVPAVSFLDESLNLQATFGIILIVIGIIMSIQAKTKIVGAFSLVFLWLAIGAAATCGLGQPISKFGLNDLSKPFFATLVMVTSAAVFISATHLTRDRITIRFE